MLCKAVFKCLRETIEEVVDLDDVWVVLALGLVEDTFKFGEVRVYTVSSLFNIHQLRSSFTSLVRVEVNTRELIENSLIALNSRFLCLCELGKNHSLNSSFKVEVYVVELCHITSNSLSVHQQLCLDAQQLCVKFVYLAVKFFWVRERRFRT